MSFDMFDIEIIRKLQISYKSVLILCNVYDNNKALIKESTICVIDPECRDIRFLDFDVNSSDIDNLNDLCFDNHNDYQLAV